MDKNDTNQGKIKVYEIGYLLVPTIAEENVATEVEAIKALIANKGSAFISEDFPKMKPLAYTMVKAVGSERRKFDKGYFGWVKFEVAARGITEIKAELDRIPNILRYLIIETVRENTLIGQKMVFRPAPGEKGAVEGVVAGDAPKASEEEIDKTIENLVVE